MAPVAPLGATQLPASVDASRYGGADRYATSLLAAEALAAHAGGGFDSVVMVSGRNWTDAVVAAPLAGLLGTAVLATPPHELRADAAQFLQRSEVSRALLIGTDSDATGVGPGVVRALQQLGISVERVARDDHYATSVAAADALGTPGDMGDLGRTAIVASGEVFTDALVAGPFAARGPHPVLLTPPDGLHPGVADYLTRKQIEHVVLMGGTAALHQAVEDSVRALDIDVTRLAGATRYDTAVAAAKLVAGRYGEGCFTDRRSGLARADVPFDSFSAAPLLARLCAPLLLADFLAIPASTIEYLNRAGGATSAASRRSIDLRVFGGYAAISRTAVRAYEKTFSNAASLHVQHRRPCLPNLGSEPMPVLSDGYSRYATFSPDCSRIAYSDKASIYDYSVAVWTALADGTDRVRLASGGMPVWSPDGTRIAFVRYSEQSRTGAGGTHIHVINADGSREKQLTAGYFPVWSPDGTRIAFVGESKQSRTGAGVKHIHVINADGSREKQLTAGDFRDGSPAWSPDGARIAFTRLELESEERQGQDEYIAVMDSDGLNVRPLTGGGPKDRDPAWSPDGSQIAYGAGDALRVMKADGSVPRSVPVESFPEGHSWSPDGTALAFAVTRIVDDETYARGLRVDNVISIASIDGARTAEVVRYSSHLVTNGAFGTFTVVLTPKWAPDGRSILYERNTQTGNVPRTYVAPVPDVRPAPVAEDCRPMDSANPWIGFAPRREFAPSLGTLRIGVLFMDFADAPAAHTTRRELARGDPAYTQEVIAAVSYGNLFVEFVPHHTWLRAPQTADHYSRPGGHFEIAETAAAMALDEFDFDDIDAFLTVLPSNHFGAATLAGQAAVHGDDDRRVAAVINSSRAYFDSDGWKDFLPPITMQLIGAPYLGDPGSAAHTDRRADIPELLPGQRWHRVEVGIRKLGAWFASDDEAYYGEHYEPLSWVRWQFGWLKPEQVACVNQPEAIVRLAPLAGSGEGTVMTAIPASPSAIIVLESRRRIGHDALSSAHRDAIASGEADGGLIGDRVLAYVVDPSARWWPIRLLGDNGFNTLERYPFLAAGDAATVAGYTITVTADAGHTHTVTIVKSN